MECIVTSRRCFALGRGISRLRRNSPDRHRCTVVRCIFRPAGLSRPALHFSTGVHTRGTPSILARLGGVLRAGEADETVRDPQPVDSASSADVLLETLAVRPHAGSESRGARRSAPTGLAPRKESPSPVAHGQDHCQRGQDDKRLAARSGTDVAEIALAQACSAPSNRVVRTRMLRGVGGRAERSARLPD